MKIELTSYSKKYCVETENEDVSIEDLMDMFEGLLFQAGWHVNTIAFAFRDKADQMLEKVGDV